MRLFNFFLLLTLILVVDCFSPMTVRRRQTSSHSYRTGDEEMDILFRNPDVELLEYRRAIFNPRQYNKANALEKEKRKKLELELILGRGAMVLFTVMIGHEFITGENLVHTFLYGQ